MKSPKLATLLTALALSPAFATETDPVGFVSVTVPANSDAVLAVPLNRAAEFKGVIQSIAGNVITVAGTPAWTASQFVQALPGQPKTYAVQIASGAKEGLIAQVTANTNNTLTVTVDASDDLTGIGTVAVPVDPDGAGPLTAQSDQIDIMPYWTPSALFSAGAPANAELFFYSSSLAGVNLAPAKLYLYDSGAWADQDTFGSADNTALNFGVSFVMRNPTGTAFSASFVGSVPMSKHRYLIKTLANNQDQDIRIGYSSPVPETIGSLGLGFSTDDQLFVYNNAASGMNKAPSKILLYDSGAWIDTDDFSNVSSSFQLQPGQGYVFRRKGTATPQTIAWSHLQSYLAP